MLRTESRRVLLRIQYRKALPSQSLVLDRDSASLETHIVAAPVCDSRL